jgi:long-subunit fatty acid transport protein
MVAASQMTQEQLKQLAAGLGLSPGTAGAMTVAQVQGAYNTAAATYEASANQTADKNLDCDQSGWGVTPIIGFSFHWENLNIGAKYEFLTNMDIENKTKVDDTGMFPDGEKTPQDIPALLTVGAQYKIIPAVSVSVGYHHFFDSAADMAKDKQQYINGGINEYLLGTEWQINKMFLISAGGQITRTGVTDDYQTDLSYSLNSYSIGLGGAINVTEKVKVNLGYFWTVYDDWSKTSSNYNGTGMTGTDVFSRTNKVFGIGVDFRL